jgi:hypothetical protein
MQLPIKEISTKRLIDYVLLTYTLHDLTYYLADHMGQAMQAGNYEVWEFYHDFMCMVDTYVANQNITE